MVYINTNKLDSFNFNSNNFLVIMDFDNTITTLDSEDSWTVLQNPSIMPLEFEKQCLLLYEKYGSLEHDYSLDISTKSIYMKKWYLDVMDLFYSYGLTYEILKKCVSAR